MKNIYKNMYGEDNQVDLRKNPRVLEMLKIVNGLDLKNKNILDIGCYDGTLIKLIKNKDNHFYGLDASEYACQKSEDFGIKVSKFDLNSNQPLPYSSHCFDLVVAGDIIEHIYDTHFFLSEVRRLLGKQGKFLVTTPNIASFGRRLLFLLGKNPLIEVSLESGNSGHIRYFTFNSLAELLFINKFQILKSKSDIINFSSKGMPSSKSLAEILPKFGQSIIYLTKKI